MQLQAVYGNFGGIVLAQEEGENIAAALGPKVSLESKLQRIPTWTDQVGPLSTELRFCKITASSLSATRSTRRWLSLRTSIVSAVSNSQSKLPPRTA